MTENSYFLDSNIFLRHLTFDNPVLSPKATEIFEKIAKYEIKGFLTTLVLHEVSYVLEKVYKVRRKDISKALRNLLKLKSLMLMDLEKENLNKALDDYKNTQIDFPDCIYKQIALSNKLGILSFDKDFSKIKINTGLLR